MESNWLDLIARNQILQNWIELNFNIILTFKVIKLIEFNCEELNFTKLNTIKL